MEEWNSEWTAAEREMSSWRWRMGGLTGGWMGGWMNGWMDEWVDG